MNLDDERNLEQFEILDAFDAACNELKALMDLLTLLEDTASTPREGTLITMGLRGLDCLERMDYLFREAVSLRGAG